ncbi:MAG: DNA mismatch repair protein MutS [Pseudomonadota bacterium]
MSSSLSSSPAAPVATQAPTENPDGTEDVNQDSKKTKAKANKATGPTPMMAQYLSIKARVPDALLFYRMGDFYELFFDDAIIAARDLDITLTRRGQHQGDDIPMCGVPFHAYESYLSRLIRMDHTVAICEQMEAPEEAKKRGAKSVVARDIVRIVTPGTLTEDTLLDARRNNFIVALGLGKSGRDKKSWDGALACADVSTGEFFVRLTSADRLDADLSALMPSELILPDWNQDWTQDRDQDAASSDKKPSAFAEWQQALGALTHPLRQTRQPVSSFAPARALDHLRTMTGVATLDGLGDFSPGCVAAIGGLLGYVTLTQAGTLPKLQPPRFNPATDAVAIDPTTRASLEIYQTQTGERKGSLIHSVDATVTGPGARLLARRLSAPLTNPDTINGRLDEIDFFISAKTGGEDVRRLLKDTPDIARALSRLSLGRGGPRDLTAIRAGISAARRLAGTLNQLSRDLSAPLTPTLKTALIDLEDGTGTGFSGLLSHLNNALSDEVPLLARDGGFVRKGYDTGLDSVKTLRDDARRVIAGLEGTYRSKTGIKSLKVRQNNVLGFFVEVPTNQGDKLLAGGPVSGSDSPTEDHTFIHRQTLASCVRFTTTQLADLDTRISRAGGEALAREQEIFEELATLVLSHANALQTAATALAQIDVATANAHLAVARDFVRPQIDDSLSFSIVGGRHPVVEAALARTGERFIANDCRLGDVGNCGDPPANKAHVDGAALLWLVTGPNMAGKSTFLRQNALIAILAQAGVFVPATSAHLGVADRIFSRVGASDDLARGRSTFMVEMVETAAILNQAGPRSLVVMDEIGRGTATFDGLSIAWAALEYLHDHNRCRGLFATHYHELTQLEGQLARLRNVSMQVREWKNDVIFLHEVGRGAADRSYGVAVATIAGLPRSVTRRAAKVLKNLEATRQKADTIDALPLFSAMSEPATDQADAEEPGISADLIERLDDLDPDQMSPRDALDALYALKAALKTD